MWTTFRFGFVRKLTQEDLTFEEKSCLNKMSASEESTNLQRDVRKISEDVPTTQINYNQTHLQRGRMVVACLTREVTAMASNMSTITKQNSIMQLFLQ